jgi:Protein of unknown function (DUF3311)
VSAEDERPPAHRRLAPWLLLVPVLAWMFPWLYARANPKLGPFPFFVWYQFATSVGTGLVIGLVYVLRDRERGR